MEKIQNFIIGLILIGLFAFTISLSVSHLALKYGNNYDNTSIEKYSSYKKELQNLSASLHTETSSNSSKITNIFDMLGDIVRGGIGTLKLTWTSYDTFSKMSNDAIEQSNIAETNYLKLVISAIVIIIISFVVIKAILNR